MLDQGEEPGVGVDVVEDLALVDEVAQAQVGGLVQLLHDADDHLAQLAAPGRGLGVVEGRGAEAAEGARGHRGQAEQREQDPLERSIGRVQ